MISIADTVTPDRTRLSLRAEEEDAAIRETADLLRTAPEVLDWETLNPSLLKSRPCLDEHGADFGICLPHVRTDAVNAMVMSIGRSTAGIRFKGCVKPVRYIFCIGVPKALDSAYLRIVGLLARILKNPVAEAELRSASNADEFIDVLMRLETEL